MYSVKEKLQNLYYKLIPIYSTELNNEETILKCSKIIQNISIILL